ncbi:MAG: lipocalin-like domain-containing protein [Gammaproteobacteria bacterium]
MNADTPHDRNSPTASANNVPVDRLAGTWQILSVVTKDQINGTEREPFGPSPVGYLIYTRDGRVMTMIAAAGRPHLPSDRRPSETELAGAFMSAAGYAGRYTINGDQIVHQIEVCTLPNWSGVTQIRHLAMEGEKLMLTTPRLDTPAIGDVRWSMVWKRAV